MTRRRTYHAWYVIAQIDGGSGNAQTRRLLGPFDTQRAAARMIRAVRYACTMRLDDERYRRAAFVTDRLTVAFGELPPPGRLDLSAVVDDEYIRLMIEGSRNYD